MHLFHHAFSNLHRQGPIASSVPEESSLQELFQARNEDLFLSPCLSRFNPGPLIIKNSFLEHEASTCFHLIWLNRILNLRFLDLSSMSRNLHESFLFIILDSSLHSHTTPGNSSRTPPSPGMVWEAYPTDPWDYYMNG